MCSVRRSRLFVQLTAVSASDHLRAFSVCFDSGICMATLLPHASSRLLLMDCVCLCVRARPCVFLAYLMEEYVTGHPKEYITKLCTYMRAFTPYSIMEDFNGLVFHHTVYVRRLLGPCAGCPAPSCAARNGRSWRPSHIKHAPPSPRPLLLQWNVVHHHPLICHPLLYLLSFPKAIRRH